MGACGKEAPQIRPKEDFLARFLERRWWDLRVWYVADLVAGLRAYIDGDHPLYPEDGPRCRELHKFLFQWKPDPRAFLPLFGKMAEVEEVDDARLRRDVVAIAVVTSFIRRLARNPDDPDRPHLYDVIAEAGVYSAFDPAYGDAHPKLTEDVTDFFGEPRFVACAESRASLRKVAPRLLAQWRGRVTNKGSSTFFGILLRHLGAEGADLLAAEWDRMKEEERFDYLMRLAGEETIGAASRARVVAALSTSSIDLREAALEALRAHAAPVGDLDASSREVDIERVLPGLRKWAAKP